MKNYYRVMLGKQSAHAAECFSGNYIGADLGIAEDLTGQLPDEWRAFNKVFIPKYLALLPGKSKIAAGLACGMLWTVAKGINKGDIVLCPDGTGTYHVGEVIGDYFYAPGLDLPHRRTVRWLDLVIDRAAMSEGLRNSTGSIGTVSSVTGHRDEIERFLVAQAAPRLISTDETVDDPVAFAMEKHLEDFLVQNWEQTELGKSFEIFQEDGERVGQQYPTDTGPIDILAISKDKKQLLVVELKKGRASDVVVGQTLRYMGFVAQELAEPEQETRGVIIALDDDQRIRRALAVAPNIDFYRYQVSFKLLKG
ncbi:restriction system protein [Humidesulfovibrio mexicanus]|uniref:Restriction system protein n=1 Tax=Humidesulfovibrio mexicanus TaxID=147047 RepID=A0A239B5V3_9BACT|nr:endonuclease NucS domain-containing protein [Humidesulfovibrio mexicanus]SNS03022.1 restriction system protein [Humidesulfovibrio mexicanus]